MSRRVVFAPAAPLTFVNAEYVRGQIDKALDQRRDVRLLVIEANGIALIDFTAAQTMIQAIARLRKRGIDVALARLEAIGAMTAAARAGLLDVLGKDHVFHSVEEAVRALGPSRSAT